MLNPTGPIPGENYTSDTKNYPWHRPPEITTMDAGIESAMKQLSTKSGAFGLLNTLQTGVTVAQASTMFVTSGIGAGKWTPDFAMLLAGPVARMMEIMAKDAGIKFEMGLEEDYVPTISFINASIVEESVAESAGEELSKQEESIKMEASSKAPPATGFMADDEDII